jgi:putative PIG3 family NAD(P)H quinone oxidoreductase
VHAIVVPEPGGPLQWSEVEDPAPAADEVVIEVAAAGVNRADLLQRAGHYPPPPGVPPYLGLECSGVIAAVGSNVDEWAVGDRVCALLAGGGYAERVAVPRGQVLPLPDGVELVDAAALPEAACTVWSNVFDAGHLAPLDTLLVHGGGSGIGTMAIQLAAAHGSRVVATARAHKHPALRALGAEITIDYTSQDFVSMTRAATGNVGADLILDIIGASYLDRNVAALAPGGRLVVIGLQGGRTAELDLGTLLTKRGRIIATTLRARPVAEKTAIVAAVREHVWPLVGSGIVRPVVHAVLPITEAAQALEILDASTHVGKVLLTTQPS